jgi:hypothetical protein
MLIDVSAHQQSYVEDCETCCNPMQINVAADNGEITSFEAINLEQ